MGKTTTIAWCTSTFGPWIGCTEVSPGCDQCYARALDKRHRWGGATHWGAGVPRHRTSENYWKQPLRWNEQQWKAITEARINQRPPPPPWRVFCASLADVFDNEVPEHWRTELFDLIAATPYLEWLLATKRVGNAGKMMEAHTCWTPAMKNVRVIASIVNQEEAERDLPKLLALPVKNGVSYEPALGPVDWVPWLKPINDPHGRDRAIEWLIMGGESTQGAKARECHIGWFESALVQCRTFGCAPFIKQLGSNPRWEFHETRVIRFKDRAAADPAEWPAHLQVQEFPDE